MKAKAFLLELLAGFISALGWFIGWPTLRTLSTALNALGLTLTTAGVVFGVVLGIKIIRSQMEPPYGTDK